MRHLWQPLTDPVASPHDYPRGCTGCGLRAELRERVSLRSGGQMVSVLVYILPGGRETEKLPDCDRRLLAHLVPSALPLGDRAMCRADSMDGRRAGDHPEREWPIGTLFGTAPGHMGTEWQGRHAHGKARCEAGRCVDRPEPLSRACSDPSEWPEDLRVREFPEVPRG